MADIKSKLVLDNAQFNKRAKASKIAIGGLAGGLRLMGGAAKFAAISVTAAAVGLAALITRSATTIDRLGKVAKTTGFAAKTLQQFQFAAELSGVGADQAAVALRRFARRLGEAQKGTGELLPALKKLGIEVRDGSGNLKTGEQVLFEFADGLANTDEATERLALAFKAFDSEGAELVEVLKNGSDGLSEFFDEAERLGFLLSTESIQGVEKFNDEFNKLQRVLGGVVNQTVAALAETMEDLTTKFTDFVLELIDAKGGSEEFGKFLKDSLLDVAIKTVEVFEMLVNTFITLFNLIRSAGRAIDPTFGLSPSDIVLLEQYQAQLDAIGTKTGITPVIPGPLGMVSMTKQLVNGFAQGFKDPAAAAEITKNIQALYKDIEPQDFQSIIDLLIGDKEENKAKIKENIVDEFKDVPEMIVEGVQGKSFFIALLDKIYGDEGRARVDQFLTEFYDEAENMLDRLKGFMKLIFGPELVESIKNAFANSDIGDFVKTLAEGLVKGVKMFEDSLADAIVSGKADFSALGDHLKQVLAKALVQKFITGPIMGIFGLAKGGPAKAGTPYIVGEEGPELFVPGASGTVVPNNQLQSSGGGMGGGTVINISAVDTQSFQSAIARDPEFIFNVSRAGARRTPGG